MDNINKQKRIETIKEICEQVGYGHIMSLVSALWRKKLKDDLLPESGAFISTILMDIKKKHHKMTKQSMAIYDDYVKDY